MEGNSVEQQEIVDSLKLEASALPPDQDRRLNSIYSGLADNIVQNYGSFIPPQTKDNLPNVTKNIIHVQDVKGFAQAWAGDDPRSEMPVGILLDPEGVVILPSLNSWDDLDVETKDRVEVE